MMSIFSWLRGDKHPISSSPDALKSAGSAWSETESGNPTISVGKLRITVFSSDGGFKFCVAKGARDDDPYFSEPYSTEDIARSEALLFVNGERPRQRSMKDEVRERRENRRSEHFTFLGKQAEQLADAVGTATLTELRRSFKKVSSATGQLLRNEVRLCDEDGRLLRRYQELGDHIQAEIARRKSRDKAVD